MGRATADRVERHLRCVISIHALRGEGDTWLPENTAAHWISIHALRGEGDTHPTFENCDYTDFNPRPPWGGRPSPSAHRGGAVHFNPRPPWGGRRDIIESIFLFLRISIHALRGEGDLKNIHTGEIYPDFNPRPPWGERL